MATQDNNKSGDTKRFKPHAKKGNKSIFGYEKGGKVKTK